MNAMTRNFTSLLQTSLGSDKVTAVYEDARGVVMRVHKDAILPVLSFLRDRHECLFNMLADEIGIDFLKWPAQSGPFMPTARFGIYYNLYSLATHERIFVELFVDEGESVPSAVSLFASANWAERIIYDLFGVVFTDHPDLRRIYMPDDYGYFPMRKDFPRRGIHPQDYPQE